VDFSVKFLELLLETVPSAKRIGFLVDGGSSNMVSLVEAFKTLVEQRRIQGYFATATKPDDLAQAMAQLAKDRIQGLVLLPARFFVAERERLVKIAMANRWPIVCGPHELTEAGALLSYGPDRVTLYRRSAYYVDRILKGAKPSELPIEQPTKFELVVNMKTAKSLGIKIPNSVLVRADKVIE
jgi:putative ABC transport system substrate-binding protein